MLWFSMVPNPLHILTLHQTIFFPLIHFSTEVMPLSKLHITVLPLKLWNNGAIPNLLHHMFCYPAFKDTKLKPVFHTC